MYQNHTNQGRVPLFFCLVLVMMMLGCTGGIGPIPERAPGLVDGVILDLDNVPVNQANVRLENAVQASGTVLTDTKGKFSIASADPGVYDLIAEKDITGIRYGARVRHLNVHSESFVSRDLQIRPTGIIRGRVTLEGFSDYSGVTVSVVGTGRSMVTTAGGYFSFDKLAYTYRDAARNIRYVYEVTYSKPGFSLEKTVDVELEAGGLTVVGDKELQNLDPSGISTLSGTVKLEARNGAAGSVITLLGTNINPQTILSDQTTQNQFAFKDVPAGNYTIEVAHPDYHRVQITFQIAAGQTAKDLGTISLTNVSHLPEDRKALDLTLAPSLQQIAYAKYLPGESRLHREIFLTDPLGVNYDRRITDGAKVAEDDRGMTWSSDGQYIVYVEKNENTVVKQFRLAMVSSSGGLISPLSSYEIDLAQPSFEPSGLRLMFYRFVAFGEILVSTLTKKTSGFSLQNEFLVLQERNDQVSRNQFSAFRFGQSERLLFTKDDNGGVDTSDNGVFTIPTVANNNAILKFPVLGTTFANSATFGPDNDKIAYCISSGVSKGMYLANVDGTGAERISDAWGRSLYFTKEKIYYIDRRSSFDRRIGVVIVPAKWR